MPATEPSATPLRFGPFTLDIAGARLSRDGEELALRPKAFELLALLVSRPGELLSKDELLDTVWGRRYISEGVIKSVVSELRKLLDEPLRASWIDTVPRRGYRFTGAVELAAAEQSAPPLTQGAGQLSPPLSPTVGRAADLAALTALLATQRLLTIAGPSGVGKTRLAQALAAQQPGWADGAWFIELAPLAAESVDAASLRAMLARTLQLGAGATASNEALGRALRPLSLLLVLDNAEHLLDTLAPLVSALLAQAPRLHLLVTSQEPLAVAGEQLYRLAPLAVPPVSDDADADALMASGAVRLFVARVAARLPGFELAPQQQQAVAAICRALDGLPLALELAAARVPVLGVHGIARLLLGDEEAGARLNLLKQGPRSAELRQRSLRDALQWSHDLLDDAQRRVLRRLGVFRGGFSMQAAQQVCADATLDDWGVLDAVHALVDKSLIAPLATLNPGDPPRLTLLESPRAFALERLQEAGELDATRRRHLAATRAGWARADLRALSEPALSWLARQLPEVDNLRAALRFALAAGDAPALDDALALLAGAGMFWPRAGLVAEGAAACEALRAHAGLSTDADLKRGFALTLGVLALYGQAYSDAEAARAVAPLADQYEQAGDGARAYFSLYLFNKLSVRLQSSADFGGLLARMQALERPGWSELLTRFRRAAVGYDLRLAGQVEPYLGFCRDELARWQRLGARQEAWTAAQGLMLAEHDNGQTESALATGRAALADARSAGRLREQSALLILWTTMLAESGDSTGTRSVLAEALPVLHSGGTPWMAHVALAWLAAHEDRPLDAARLVGWHDAALAAEGRTRPGLYIGRSLRLLSERLLQQLGAAAFAAAQAEGSRLDHAAAERLALG